MQADIVFLSYREENAEHNWRDLKQRYPEAKRVHGIKGIREAHGKAAEVARHDYLFIVDGDNRICEGAEFHLPDPPDEDTVHVWRAQNAVNGLVYGYGGIKLWPRAVFERNLRHYDDHAMSATTHYRIVNEILSITAFNTSEISSFRAGFRESVKLAKGIVGQTDRMARERLRSWLTIGLHAPFGKFCLLGARVGVSFYLRQANRALALINEFQAIETVFAQALSAVGRAPEAHDAPATEGLPDPLETFLRTPVNFERVGLVADVADADASGRLAAENTAAFERRHPRG